MLNSTALLLNYVGSPVVAGDWPTGACWVRRGREFSIDIVYDDTVTDRSVVAFNVHWDDSEVTFGGIENLKAIADSDSAACQVGGSQPTAVGTAGNNTKVGGPSLTIGRDAGVGRRDVDITPTDTRQKTTAVRAPILRR